MCRRLPVIAVSALLAVGGAAGALAAGPKAPNDGHYANHARGKLSKNAIDFDVKNAKVQSISHFDKCANATPLKWPKTIPFRKGVFVFHGTLQDFTGSSYAVKFTGTAVSKTRINGVLDIKVTKSNAPITKQGCHYTTTYKAKRVGPPEGVV